MAGGFSNPIVGGGGALVYPSIHSPNYVAGGAGWSINKDGSAQFNQLVLILATPGAGEFIYSGPAALGNLIGSWAGTGGEDAEGNLYPAGLNASQGTLIGMLLISATINGATITSAMLNAPSITQAAISGGTITQTVITFNSAGGLQLVYTTTTTTTTFSTAGAAQWTCPAGVTAAKVECWGGGAGGGGGSATAGGEGGGGGEYAQEAAYPVIPGNVYSLVVGAAGAGGATGNAGSSGGQTSFDGTGVVANPGLAGSAGTGGAGGSGSTNTVEEPGGGGGNATSTGGAGGGGSGGATGPGGAGANEAGAGGAAGGAAGTGGGAAGGAGGAATAGGNPGTAPGGGGGGAGDAPTGGTGQLIFDPVQTVSYFGSGVQRNLDGDLYQGYAPGNPGGDGDQYAYWLYNGPAMAAALSGKTITSVYFNPLNLHSWYDSGMYMALGALSNSAGVQEGLQVNWINQGAGPTLGLGAAFGPILFDGSGNNGMVVGKAGSVGEAGNAYYYGYFSTDSGALTVNYETGSGSVTAGAGAHGQVKLTYTSASTLECAISPAAGSDAASNAYGAAYTGPVTAFVPGSNPTVVETLHTLSPTPASWSGSVVYKKIAESNLFFISIRISIASGTAVTNGETFGTLGTGYFWSGDNQYVNCNLYNGSWSGNAIPVQVGTGGVLTYLGPTFTPGAGVTALIYGQADLRNA